jgi:hypothetical protein
MPYSTHAVLVDIDGNGTQGMVASKWVEGQHQNPHRRQYLFWLCNGELRQQTFGFERFGISSTGRLVFIDVDGACNISLYTYTLFDFVDGELSLVKIMNRWEYWALGWMLEDYCDPDYLHIFGSEYALRTYTNDRVWEMVSLTHEEFDEMLTQHGLHETKDTWELPDETQAILSLPDMIHDWHPIFLEPPSYTIICVSDEISITIAYVTEELLAQYSEFIEFSHRGRNPRTDGVAFISNVTVSNFRYISINGAEIQFIVEEDLFVLDELLPNTPLLVDWVALGSGAYGGFAFDDENGVTRYFGFNYDAAGDTAFRFKEFSAYDFVFEFPSIGIRLYTRLLSGGVIIWSNTRLPDFELVEVLVGNAEGEDIYLYPGEVLLSIGALEPGIVFWVDIALSGATIPTSAISFLDEKGVRIYFLLSLSGYDGSIDLALYPLDGVRI